MHRLGQNGVPVFSRAEALLSVEFDFVTACRTVLLTGKMITPRTVFPLVGYGKVIVNVTVFVHVVINLPSAGTFGMGGNSSPMAHCIMSMQ